MVAKRVAGQSERDVVRGDFGPHRLVERGRTRDAADMPPTAMELAMHNVTAAGLVAPRMAFAFDCSGAAGTVLYAVSSFAGGDGNGLDARPVCYASATGQWDFEIPRLYTGRDNVERAAVLRAIKASFIWRTTPHAYKAQGYQLGATKMRIKLMVPGGGAATNGSPGDRVFVRVW